MKNRIIAVTLSLAIVFGFTFQWRGASASQATSCMPTTGTVSGLTFAQDVNNALAAFLSVFSGATAPVTDCSLVLIKGQRWLDTTTNTVKEYDGANWLPIGTYDASHVWKPIVGGGVETLSSAATTDLCAVPGSLVNITGSITITSFSNTCAPGVYKMLSFTGTPILTNSATLLLPSRANISTTSGDVAMAVYLGSGNWQIATYSPANGQAVANVAVEVGTIQYSIAASLPANNKYVFGYGQSLIRVNFPDFVNAASRTQSAVRVSGNATLTGLADTSGMGLGMPVEGVGIQSGSTIVSVTSSSILLSLPALSNGTNVAQVFFTGYGAGGSTTTIGVPDCRGRALAGRDDMGGSLANRMTAAGFGVAGVSLNSSGSSLETVTMAAANIYSHTHANVLNFNDPGHSHQYSYPGAVTHQDGTQNFDVFFGATTQNTSTSTTGITSSITNAAFGSTTPTPMRTVQPTLIAQCIVRVLVMNDTPLDIPANDNARLAISRRFA